MSECTIDNAFLCKHSMFGGLTDEELLLIHDYLDEKSYPKGTCILKQGEPNNSVYFIVKGDVSIQKHPLEAEDQERVITTLHAGDSFGEMELIDIQSCAASAICLTDATIITLSNKDLYKLSTTHLKTYTMLILNLARDISRRLRSTDNLLALISKKSP
ncbi:MAG: cyclic nucleotide-binding domain-containing protein [Sphaerochaeta sp.]|nr:cyclic nucleotide-binding domain-containing protein [Sphaerochaeta sp.]